MRVIGGKFKGRTLLCPRGLCVRPTADRIKETIFNVLGDRAEQATALDAFAGVGALGIEALSRGAKSVHFVERDATAIRFLRRNLRRIGIGEEGVLHRGDAIRLMRKLCRDGAKYDLVLCDPPYGEGYVGRILTLLQECPLLEMNGAFVLQHHVKEPLGAVSSPYMLHKSRKIGDTCISIIVVSGNQGQS